MFVRSILLGAAGAGFFILGGCDSAQDSDGMAADRKASGVVKATRIFRCDDRGLVYVDFLSDGVTARLRRSASAAPIELRSPSQGRAFVAEGYELSGDSKTVVIAREGRAPLNCVR